MMWLSQAQFKISGCMYKAGINASHQRQDKRVTTILSGCMRLLSGMSAIIQAKVDLLSPGIEIILSSPFSFFEYTFHMA